MACPLFIPTLPLGELVSIPTPLGDLYAGRCAADETAVIGPETLRRFCNFGYARGRCERAGHTDDDAVRLLVRAERAGVVEIAWAVERNHHPVAVGNLEIATNPTGTTTGEMEAGPAETAPPDPLSRQAYACAVAYMRQMHPCPAPVGRMAAGMHQ